MDLGIISWIIVLIPFLFMAVITTMILYIFGWDVATGQQITTTYVNPEQTKQPVYELPITSPPYPPWMLPDDSQPQYLTVSTQEANTDIVNPPPDYITIMPMPTQNLG
jgi:hypothetical protein